MYVTHELLAECEQSSIRKESKWKKDSDDLINDTNELEKEATLMASDHSRTGADKDE